MKAADPRPSFIEVRLTTDDGDPMDPAKFEELLDSAVAALARIGVDVDYSASLANLTARLELLGGEERSFRCAG